MYRLQVTEWEETGKKTSNFKNTGNPGKPGKQLLVHSIGSEEGLPPGLYEHEKQIVPHL